MSAMSSVITQPALFAGQNDMQPMPSAMPFICMAATTAAISIIFVETGVSASVSLFVVVLHVSLLLLASLVLLSLLTLSGLTGLLASLVGLSTELDTGKAQGD